MNGDIPRIGLGTYGRWGDAGRTAILRGLELGYRHLDTAQSYENEAEVGEAIRASGVPRDDIFVTTKVADTRLARADFLASVEESLERLRLDRVDLLLVHWPSAGDRVPLEDYIGALAEAQSRGWTRFIGVSNFTIGLLERVDQLLGPGALATNQVEIHPYLQVPRMRDHARARGLLLTAYQPLAKGTIGIDPIIRRIAEAHDVAPATISLAFLLAEGHAVIPASSQEGHLRDNLRAGDIRLTAAQIDEIRALDRGERRINPEKSPRWDD